MHSINEEIILIIYLTKVEFGVFRELLNFCQIDTEDIDRMFKISSIIDGAEGRLSKPYHMSKVSDYVGVQ